MKSAITVSDVSHGKTKQVAEHSDSYRCDQPQIHRLHLPSFNFWWWHAHMSNIPATVTKIPNAEASNWTAARTHERSQQVSFHSLLSQFTSFLGNSRFAGWPLFMAEVSNFDLLWVVERTMPWPTARLIEVSGPQLEKPNEATRYEHSVAVDLFFLCRPYVTRTQYTPIKKPQICNDSFSLFMDRH